MMAAASHSVIMLYVLVATSSCLAKTPIAMPPINPAPPAPPTPDPCTSNCDLVEMPPNTFHEGKYSATGEARVTTLAGCQAACLKDVLAPARRSLRPVLGHLQHTLSQQDRRRHRLCQVPRWRHRPQLRRHQPRPLPRKTRGHQLLRVRVPGHVRVCRHTGVLCVVPRGRRLDPRDPTCPCNRGRPVRPLQPELFDVTDGLDGLDCVRSRSEAGCRRCTRSM